MTHLVLLISISHELHVTDYTLCCIIIMATISHIGPMSEESREHTVVGVAVKCCAAGQTALHLGCFVPGLE